MKSATCGTKLPLHVAATKFLFVTMAPISNHLIPSQSTSIRNAPLIPISSHWVTLQVAEVQRSFVKVHDVHEHMGRRFKDEAT